MPNLGNDIRISYGQAGGDQCYPYYIELGRKFTVKEFVDRAVGDKNEWGSIHIQLPGYNWTDFDKDGKVIANPIPFKYIVEMVCDWIGAGKTYSKEKWTQDEPLNYFYKVRAGRHFHPETEKVILTSLKLIRDLGLDEFHKLCRNAIKKNKK